MCNAYPCVCIFNTSISKSMSTCISEKCTCTHTHTRTHTHTLNLMLIYIYNLYIKVYGHDRSIFGT